jgi:hypothetical protein
MTLQRITTSLAALALLAGCTTVHRHQYSYHKRYNDFPTRTAPKSELPELPPENAPADPTATGAAPSAAPSTAPAADPGSIFAPSAPAQ